MGKASKFHNPTPFWWYLIQIFKNLTDFGGDCVLLMPTGSRTCWLKIEETLKWGEQTSCQVSLLQTQREKSQQGKEHETPKFFAVGNRKGKSWWPLTALHSLLFTSQKPSQEVPLRYSFLFLVSASPVKQPYGTLLAAKCFCLFHFQLPLEMFNVALQNDWQKNSTALFTMVLWCFIEWNHLFRNVFQRCGLDLEFTAAI